MSPNALAEAASRYGAHCQAAAILQACFEALGDDVPDFLDRVAHRIPSHPHARRLQRRLLNRSRRLAHDLRRGPDRPDVADHDGYVRYAHRDSHLRLNPLASRDWSLALALVAAVFVPAAEPVAVDLRVADPHEVRR